VKRLGLSPIALILALAALGPSPAGAEEPGPWSFRSELDLYLGLKAGAEYRLSDSLGVRGTLGICAISPLQTTYTLVGVRHFRGPESGLQLDLEFGLIQAIFNVLEPIVDLDPKIDSAYYYWIPGACASIGYLSRAGHSFAIRAGAGLCLNYDLGRWQRPSFLPNLAIEYGFSPKK
jgi:hypothetical protein